jgi:hypothetical protein
MPAMYGCMKVIDICVSESIGSEAVKDSRLVFLIRFTGHSIRKNCRFFRNIGFYIIFIFLKHLFT